MSCVSVDGSGHVIGFFIHTCGVILCTLLLLYDFSYAQELLS
jgi:hypothetical protein